MAASTSGISSQSLPPTILNLEDNKVKIQVPGIQQPPVTRTHSAVAKQASIDKGIQDSNLLAHFDGSRFVCD